MRREAVRQGVAGRRACPEDRPQRAPRLRLARTGSSAQKGLSAALADLNKAVDLDPASAYGYGVRGEVTADWDINLGPLPPDFDRLRQRNTYADIDDLPAVLAIPNLSARFNNDPDNPRYHCDLGAAYARGVIPGRLCDIWTARWRSIRSACWPTRCGCNLKLGWATIRVLTPMRSG